MFSLGFFELYYTGQRRPESRQNVVRTTQEKDRVFNLDCTESPHRARIRSFFAPPQVLDEWPTRSHLVQAQKNIRAAGLRRGVPLDTVRAC
jgi:hypothetical protein